MAPERPIETGLEGERTTMVEHVVEAAARDLNQQCRRSGIGLVGEDPLGVAEVGATPHANSPVTPGLFYEPGERFDPISTLVDERLVGASRLETAPGALDEDGIPVLRPHPPNQRREEFVLKGLRVSDPNEDRRGRTRTAWQVEIADQLDVIRRRHRQGSVNLHRELRRAAAQGSGKQSGCDEIAHPSRDTRDDHNRHESSHDLAPPSHDGAFGLRSTMVMADHQDETRENPVEEDRHGPAHPSLGWVKTHAQDVTEDHHPEIECPEDEKRIAEPGSGPDEPADASGELQTDGSEEADDDELGHH